MRNDKKNPFFTNVGLFSTSLFEHRVHARKDFPKLTDDTVKSIWKSLRDIWLAGESTLTSPKVNESDTEKEFVDPIFRALGFSYITKTNLLGVSGGDLKYPDYTLFANKAVADEARHAEQEYKFKNALCLAEGKKFGFTLNELDEEGRTKPEVGLPAIQLTEYLRMAEVDWGILTNGRQWQIYFRRGQYAATRYFEINLVDLLAHPEPRREFAIFLYLFSPDAFKRDASGKCRLDVVYEDSKKYAQEVGEPFYEGCRTALRAVFEFYQRETGAQKDMYKARLAHQASLILLFRIIAIRYLEDRGVLPTQSGEYRNVSLDVVRLKVEQVLKSGKKFSKDSHEIWQRLRLLFRDVNSGVYGIYVGHKGFESELFEIDFDKYFSDHQMSDDLLAVVIDSICRGFGKNAAQIDFFDLGVEKIGDVYNELLGLRIVQDEAKGVSLAVSASKKKELGSYFTHPKLTQLVSDGAIEYLGNRFSDRSKWLSISFCDNSCGSGHFLRQLIEDISYELFTKDAAAGAGKSQNFFRRRLAQHCAFGIDRDINAVWLTKLSLWLQTAENGKPFVFLDHHIVHGDSILSSMELPELKKADEQAIKKLFGTLRAFQSESKEEIKESRVVWKAIQKVLAPYSQHIEKQADFFKLDNETKRTYFSYAQAFPEVFYHADPSDRGFTIIAGNPPWETIEPRIQDYFKMVTGKEKSPSRKELDKWLAASPKRQKDYELWMGGIRTYSNSLKESGYKLQDKKVFTYSYFTERSIQSLAPNGLLAYIVKLGLYGDQGTSNLRSHLFRENSLKRMWIFKNNKLGNTRIFPRIDPNEKFVIFEVTKEKSEKYAMQAKQVVSLEGISREFEAWNSYDVPALLDGLNVVEVYDTANRKAVALKLSKFETIEGSGLNVTQELNLTTHRNLFTESKTDTAIYTGFELKPFKAAAPENWCRNAKMVQSYPTATKDRIGVNDIIPNSRRKIRATVIPAGTLTANSVLVVSDFKNTRDFNVAVGALNSLLTEYVIRPRLSNMHLNVFRLKGVQIPLSASEIILDKLEEQVVKLRKSGLPSEDVDAYKRIEALLCVIYGLSVSEIRGYLESFEKTPAAFVQDVVDLTELYRKEMSLAKILSFKPKTPFEKTVAQRLGLASIIVDGLKDDASFGRTKFEKVFYLVDMHESLQLKTEYYREAYGPLDQRALYNDSWGILPLAEKYGYFSSEERSYGKGKKIIQFKTGTMLKEGMLFAQEALGDRFKTVGKFIEKFKRLDTDQAELVATVYAAWNDLLLAKKDPTPEAVAKEVLERWHPSKKEKFDGKKITNCMKWMEKHELVPKGTGKRTELRQDDPDDLGF